MTSSYIDEAPPSAAAPSVARPIGVDAGPHLRFTYRLSTNPAPEQRSPRALLAGEAVYTRFSVRSFSAEPYSAELHSTELHSKESADRPNGAAAPLLPPQPPRAPTARQHLYALSELRLVPAVREFEAGPRPLRLPRFMPELQGAQGAPSSRLLQFEASMEIAGPDALRGDVVAVPVARDTASFAEEDPPPALSSMGQPVYGAVDFPLYPVWLPALFTIGGLEAGPRVAGPSDLSATRYAARFGDDFEHAAGPGFSGLLAFPRRGVIVRDPMEPIASLPVAIPSPPAPPVPHGAPPRSARNLWQLAVWFWRSASPAARRLSILLPLLALLIFGGSKIPRQSLTPDWGPLSAAIGSRAMVNLQEDFSSGLGAWRGADGSWSIDSVGSAQPGRLALYKPSLALSNYRLEFQGQIEAKAMGFVFRAIDANNYYAAKLLIVKPGPLPSVALLRYAVIDGKEGPKTQIALPMYFRSDTLYQMLVTAEGEHFTVVVNGQLADAWSDDRLKSGGVGFFADKGDIAHLRTVHVVDKEDFLGKLCYQVSLWTADRRASGVRQE